MLKNNSKTPCWVIPTKEETGPYLTQLLDVAKTGYKNHSDWFLTYRSTALKEIGSIITAELVIIKFFSDPKDMPNFSIFLVLFILSLMATFTAFNSENCCQRSFLSSIENIAAMNKIIWLMGFGGKVSHDISKVDFSNVPLKLDNTFFIPRYILGTTEAENTAQFVKKTMKNRNGVYFKTRITILSLGLVGMLIGGFGLFEINSNKITCTVFIICSASFFLYHCFMLFKNDKKLWERLEYAQEKT